MKHKVLAFERPVGRSQEKELPEGEHIGILDLNDLVIGERRGVKGFQVNGFDGEAFGIQNGDYIFVHTKADIRPGSLLLLRWENGGHFIAYNHGGVFQGSQIVGAIIGHMRLL